MATGIFNKSDGYNPDVSAFNYTNPGTSAGLNLAGNAADQNLAAAPSLEALSQMVNQINRQANQSRIPGGAALEEQSSQNIANELAGNLPDSFIQNLRTGMAQRGAAGGMGVDSPNMNAAALRGMGLESMDVQARGQANLGAAYNRAAPLWDVSQGMVTPGLYESYTQHQAQNELQRQQNAQAQSQYQSELAQRQKEFEEMQKYRYTALESQGDSQVQVAQIQADQLNRQLEEKRREYNITRDTSVLTDIARLTEQARAANMDVSLKTQQLNAQVWGTALSYMDPRVASVTAAQTTNLPSYANVNIPNYSQPNIPMVGGWQ